MSRPLEEPVSSYSLGWRFDVVAHCSSLTTPTVSDTTQLTQDDSSSSEAEFSDDNESTSAASVRRKQKTNRRSCIEESSQQGVPQTWPTTQPASDSFFSSVSLAGFPLSKTKAQPWKRHWSHLQQPLGKLGGPEIIVLCSSKWDHGRRSSVLCHWALTDTL